jgi:hypothetical protein
MDIRKLIGLSELWFEFASQTVRYYEVGLYTIRHFYSYCCLIVQMMRLIDLFYRSISKILHKFELDIC